MTALQKCQDNELTMRAFNDVLQLSVQICCDYVDHGEEKLSPSARTVRNLIAVMLNKLPLVCAALNTAARGDVRYTAVMFYERTRLGAAASGHFLEGLAPGLPLFSGETKVTVSESDLKKLRLRDVVADRIRTVGNLELLPNDSDKLCSLIRDYSLTDIAPRIPGRVHVFVARMRAICQGLQRIKPESQFRQCKNCSCSRKFYCGHAVEKAATDDDLPSPKSDNSKSYWELVAGSPEVKDEQGEFCTWACCVEWRTQLAHALPDADEATMVADYQCRKDGRARVPEALRLCGKRNERASRHLRTIQKEQRHFPALSGDELKHQRKRRIRMLNVDLGLLFAAGVLAESKALCVNKVLAGAAEGWRSRPMFHAKAVREIGKLYDKHHTGGNVISNMLMQEQFLVKVKQKATKIF